MARDRARELFRLGTEWIIEEEGQGGYGEVLVISGIGSSGPSAREQVQHR
jgi:hypothetical protein